MAKSQLHLTSLFGKQMYVNHYEIKEVRKQQFEEKHDVIDFNNYKKQFTNLNDIFNKPEMFTILH